MRITRIFVVSREELYDQEVQKILLTHVRDDIDIRIAFRDELPLASDTSGRDTDSSCDFAIFDDRVATEVFPQPGRYYGRKTSVPAEVTKYLHLFELISHCSHAVTIVDERVIPASDLLAKAS